MIDPTNEMRAEWAERAVDVFITIVATDREDAVADLLCDLMHLCQRQPERYGSFEAALARGRANYQAEVEEEQAGAQ